MWLMSTLSACGEAALCTGRGWPCHPPAYRAHGQRVGRPWSRAASCVLAVQLPEPCVVTAGRGGREASSLGCAIRGPGFEIQLWPHLLSDLGQALVFTSARWD